MEAREVRALVENAQRIVGRARTNLEFRADINNLTNAAPVLSYSQTFVLNQAVSTWLRPTSVLQPRFVKFSAQIDF